MTELGLDDWWPWYRRILETFGYDQTRDQYAADLLSKLLEGKATDPAELRKRITKRNVIVFGAGPSLEHNLKECMEVGVLDKFVTIVADGATTAFLSVANTPPTVIVTDLDGIISDIKAAETRGSSLVVHAHGDNIGQLQNYVPTFKCATGSTQVEPRPHVYNFLGFTDGDRGVFLASALGAQTIVLAGMDFGLTIGKYSKLSVKSPAIKRKKLEISHELLEWLAQKIGGDTALFNMTGSGEEVKGFRPIQPQELKELF